MKNILVSVLMIILIIATACLKSVWTGFLYFSLSFIIILSFYWIAVLLIRYLEEFSESFEEDFKMYCANLINYSLLVYL